MRHRIFNRSHMLSSFCFACSLPSSVVLGLFIALWWHSVSTPSLVEQNVYGWGARFQATGNIAWVLLLRIGLSISVLEVRFSKLLQHLPGMAFGFVGNFGVGESAGGKFSAVCQ